MTCGTVRRVQPKNSARDGARGAQTVDFVAPPEFRRLRERVAPAGRIHVERNLRFEVVRYVLGAVANPSAARETLRSRARASRVLGATDLREREPRCGSGRRRWSGCTRRRWARRACPRRLRSGHVLRYRRTRAGFRPAAPKRFVTALFAAFRGPITDAGFRRAVDIIELRREALRGRRRPQGVPTLAEAPRPKPADRRRGPLRPHPGLGRGLCDRSVHRRSRPQPRTAGAPQRAP